MDIDDLKWVALSVFVIAFFIVGGCVGFPKWNVYQKNLSGEAQLREAEWNRQITLKEAEMKKESAKHLAEAEITRAKGVAEANKIIGNSLKGNSAYLRYLWIQGLQDGSSEVIYVPTEANLPILEAGKRK